MTAGRPLKYKTTEDLEKHIQDYFDKCVPEFVKDENGKALTDSKGHPVINFNPPTLTGLALHLGFESRQSVYDYENRKDEFSYTIKRARLLCEHWTEKALLSGNVAPAAGIFVLKNYGWKDEKALEVSGATDKHLTVNIIPVKTDEHTDTGKTDPVIPE